ncbi:hypothetical protein QBC38DRAFT_56256 [Podospora fimiseda]|uniref:FAD-binding domain-containing protein n=1 Tax=Podospora fimiseda TaxID=252190 RepID=A0AAN7BW96_9PEZI|nr:hypothetical protein QBC38DRAFT_56256 [Podospora fimiseda]
MGSRIEGPSNCPLQILIVGAGIGGLTAAVGFRKQGHQVTLFERCELARETGAALHLASNCHGILRRFGIYPETFGANPVHGLLEYDYTGSLRVDADLRESLKQWQNVWVLSHRTRLHEALKDAATAKDGEGPPAILKTSSRVTDVDTVNGIVTLEGGNQYSGDLVIGADGVGSVTRKYIYPNLKPFSSGKSAFRFMVPHETMLVNPQTKDLASRQGYMTFWYANDRRVVMYPCNNNTVMNCLAIHPTYLSKSPVGTENDWDQHTTKGTLLDIFKDFDPRVQALLGMVDQDNLKAWTLLDMEKIPRWVEGKLVLLGDAAHPFLPYQGQGAAMAIEDATSLVALLPSGTPVNDIPSRLALYEKLRDERAHKIQDFTRTTGLDMTDEKRKNFDIMQFMNYNLSHDEFHHSSHALKRHLWSRNASKNANFSWRLPLAFGPLQSPRQDLLGRPQAQTLDAKTITHNVRFKTSATYLRNWLPSASFSFTFPGTVAEASFCCVELKNLGWLGGFGYNYFGLWIHGIQYRCEDGTMYKGSWLPVLFENEANPIITGREDLGMPKVFCDINIEENTIECSWKGRRWLKMEMGGLQEEKESVKQGQDDDNLLLWRYVPAVGEPGKADAEYPVIVEGKSKDLIVVDKKMVGKRGKVDFDDYGETLMEKFPTIGGIVKGLADVPIFEVLEVSRVEGRGLDTFGQARRIE